MGAGTLSFGPTRGTRACAADRQPRGVTPDAPTRGSVLAPWVGMPRRLLRRRARNAPDQVHEREYSLGRGRTDLLIIWPHPGGAGPHAAGRFVIECKVLHGSLERTIREGLLQTAHYMDRCAAQAGHLVIFDRGAGKRWEDKIFRRDERTEDGHRITVWGM